MIAAVGVTQTPATAAPNPTHQQPASVSDALERYRKLTAEAEKVHQAYLRAKEKLEDAQAKLDKANAELAAAKTALAQAKQKKQQFRKRVDAFASASFTSGAQFTKLSILLSGNSTQDFLARSSALQVLATQKAKALDRLSEAVAEARAAKQRAEQARDKAQAAKEKAAQLLQDIKARKEKLEQKIAEAKQAADQLSAQDQAQLHETRGSVPDVPAPGPAAAKAVEAALSQRGVPYVFGAESPEVGFDCSGLMMWAYAQAGISIPRTAAAQANTGTPVPRSQLKPGDLVYFYSPIHHIGMYIGNGMMVHAPNSGTVVQVDPVPTANYRGATRIVT